MKFTKELFKKIMAFLCIMAITVSCLPCVMAEEAEGALTSESLQAIEEDGQERESVTVETIYKEEESVSRISHEEAKERQKKLEKQEESGEVSLFAQGNNEYSEIVYIYNVRDLLDINGHSGGYYEFKNNISISDMNWDPIHLHNATINGNGYRVNMRLNGTAREGQYVALFSGSDNYLTDLRLDMDLDLTVNGAMVKPLGDVYAHNCTIIGDMNVWVETQYESLDDYSTVRVLYTDAVFGIDGGSNNRYIGNINVSGGVTRDSDIRPGSFEIYGLSNCVDSSFKGNIRVEKCPSYIHEAYYWVSEAMLYAIEDSRNCHMKGDIHVNGSAKLIHLSKECSITGNITANLLHEFHLVNNLIYNSYCRMLGIVNSEYSYINGSINAQGDSSYYSYSQLTAHNVQGINGSENCYIMGSLIGRHVTGYGIIGDNCSIRGNVMFYDGFNATRYIAVSGNHNVLYGKMYVQVGRGPISGGRYQVTGGQGYGNAIAGTVTVDDRSTGRTISVPRGTEPIYLCNPCRRVTDGDYIVLRNELDEIVGSYYGCERCYASLSDLSCFTYEDRRVEEGKNEEPAPTKPTSFSIQVINAISGLPIAGAEVVADGTEEVTNKDGIAVFKQNKHIGGLHVKKNGKILHTETDYIANNSVNVIQVTDVHIDTESFNFGNNASETIKGAEIDIAGKKFPIINQSMEFDLDLFEAVSVAYNPTNNTLEVLMDLQKLHAKNALSKEWKEKYSTISDIFDQACQGELDMDKIERYNKAQQREGNAGRLGKKFALDGEVTAQGFMKLELDEDMSLLEGGVLICGSLETHGTLPIPSTPWYMAYGLEGSLAGGIELTMKSSSYNEPKFDIHGKMELGIEPSIGVGYGFKDFLSVEVGVEGELKTETTFKFISFPKSFTAELTASVYALVNALGFEQKGKWNFAEMQIYPRTAAASLMSIDSPADLQIVQRDYLDGGGMELMSVEDGVIKTGLYPYSAVKLAELGSGRKLMVWLDDDTERDLYNKTALYYSYYNGSTWSEPAQVHNDGTSDFAFDLKAFGTKAVLVWQNINGELTQEDDAAKVAEKSELYSMEFNIDFFGNTKWNEPVQLTEENTNYEYAPQIMGESNNISVLWKENNENSVLAEFEALPESVYKKTLSSGEVVTVFEDTFISELLSGDGHIVAVADLDENPETSGSVLMINGTPVHYSDFLLSNLSYTNGHFYFYENGCLMKIGADSTEATLFMENAHANARVINDTTIISEIADGFGSELYVSYLQDEAWTQPVQLTDFGGRIRSWKSSLDDWNNISIGAVVADVVAEGDNVSQSVRLVYKGTAPIEDIVLTDVYAENVARGEKATVSIGIQNNTQNVINSFQTQIKAGETVLYYGDATVSALATGERGYAEINVDIPEDFEKQEVTVTVSLNNLEETNQENNSQTDVWGDTDLVAELDGKFIQAEGTAIATISNKGCEATTDTVITLENDKGETIYSNNMGTIAPGESTEVVIDIPEAFRKFAAGSNRIVYTVKVSSNSEEIVQWNNEASYVFEDTIDRIVSLDTNEVRLKSGKSYTPNVTILPMEGNPTLYMVSADDTVATVDENGTINAVGEGITTVSYYTKDAVVPSQLTVIVRDTPGDLKIAEEYEEYSWLYLTVDTTEALCPGETANLVVAAYDAAGKLCSTEMYNDVKYSKQVEVEVESFENMTLKMFLWNSTGEMIPVATSLRYFQKQISGDYEYYKNGGYAYITKYLGSGSLYTFYLPSTLQGVQVIAVEDGAFAGADLGGCELIIPSGVEKIGSKAFYNTNIAGVSIPETVTEIGDNAFGGCTSLTSFSVSDENNAYCAETKVLFNKDKTDLLQYAAGAGGFMYTIPEGVKKIGAGAFDGSQLVEVTIPESVNFIGQNAFANTDATINYCGTEEEWNRIEKTGAGILDEAVSFNAQPGGNAARFTYESNGNGLVITGFDNTGFTGATLIIPAEINGEPVREIGDSAFENVALDGVKTVIISEGIEVIGTYAFEGNASIEKITIPSTTWVIFGGALATGTNLKDIAVASGSRYFSTEDGILFNKNKTELVFYPMGKTATSYQVPEGITEIRYGAFCGSNLKEISLPASLIGIDSGAFSEAFSLEKITVDAENTEFSSVDGVVFNKDKTELIQYPIGKGTSYTIPDGVTRIGESAFQMSKLASIYIGKDVQTIGDMSLNCWNLKDIYYEGTEAEWNSISIGSWNTALDSATIHYNTVF